MTQIDKLQFKFTIPVLISIISSTAFIVTLFYNYRDENNANYSSIKTELLLLKNSIEVVSNQVQTVKTDAERNDQERKSSINELKVDFKDFRRVLDKMNFYNKGTITGN